MATIDVDNKFERAGHIYGHKVYRRLDMHGYDTGPGEIPLEPRHGRYEVFDRNTGNRVTNCLTTGFSETANRIHENIADVTFRLEGSVISDGPYI